MEIPLEWLQYWDWLGLRWEIMSSETLSQLRIIQAEDQEKWLRANVAYRINFYIPDDEPLPGDIFRRLEYHGFAYQMGDWRRVERDLTPSWVIGGYRSPEYHSPLVGYFPPYFIRPDWQ